MKRTTGLPFLAIGALLVAARPVLGCSGSIETGPFSSESSSGHASATSAASTTGGDAGGGDVGSSSVSGSSGTGGEMASDVTGTVIDDYYVDGPTVTVPLDMSQIPVEALVPGPGGKWMSFPGKGQKDGSFTIPSVPAGSFMLHLGTQYVVTSSRKLDFGADIAGRPDATDATITPTSLVTDVTGLAPWQMYDYVEWFVGNTDTYTNTYYPSFDMATNPKVGSTSAMGLSLDWSGSALIDKSKGDVLAVTQLGEKIAGGQAAYWVVDGYAALPDIAQTDGVMTNVSAALAPAPLNQKIVLDLLAKDFDGYVKDVNPLAKAPYGASVAIYTEPGAKTVGGLAYGGTLFAVQQAPGTGNLKLGALPYANPFPPSWGAYVIASEYFTVAYLAPGAMKTNDAYGGIGFLAPADSLPPGPIAPLVGPVQGLTVNGMSAFGQLNAITETPTLSWSPPVLGKPTDYQILVYQLVSDMGATKSPYAAQILTTSTSVTLPAGILKAGNRYRMQVMARVIATDATTQPNRGSPTLAWADVLTSAATP
jgi:hypothetical protein